MAQGLTKRLSFLDRYLTLWIFLAMGIGVVIGWEFVSVPEFSTSWTVGTTNIPIAIGLILMMYPPLAKVKLRGARRRLPQLEDSRPLTVQNWIIGPF